jgi:putative methionine-R-sulfoxide reductase with GAF domain
MIFLRNNQLKHLGAYLVVLALLIFVAQFYFIDIRVANVEEAESKIEYTQLAQLHNQKIAMHLQQFLNGKRDEAPAIAALLEEQDFHFKTLESGGRFGQRHQFIKPLSRLPKITFTGLRENWESYKGTILLLLSSSQEDHVAPTQVSEPLSTASPEIMDPETIDAETVVTDTFETESEETIPAVLANTTSPSAGSAGSTNSLATLTRLQYEGLSLTMSQWFDKLIADLDEEVQNSKVSLSRAKAGIVIVNALLIAGLYCLFVTVILRPIGRIKDNVAQHQRVEGFPSNELGALAGSINQTLENLRDATDFVSAIGQGDFSLDYKESLDPNYEPGKNKLADSLIEMQQKLRSVNEEEQKRKWANEGLAKFVDIMRSANDELNVLGDKIISTLVSYTRSNQGGLYVLNDDDERNRYLQLISLFAWDIRKHEQQIVKPGQGLLGQAFLEKETTYLTDVPQEYIRITSGLGDANPKAVLIVPLKVDRDVYGLVELASFNEFEKHEIAFVEKLGEMIASSLANVRTANKNKMLIHRFQKQAEEMRAQEEAMRQNMEEIQATQEEIARKEADYLKRIQELEAKLAEQQTEPTALTELKARYAQLEHESEQKISELMERLRECESRAAHWDVAQEVHQALQTNLDALRITRDVIKKKST